MTARPRIAVVNDSSEFLEAIGDVLADRYEPTLIDGSHADVASAISDSQPALLVVETGQVDDGLGTDMIRALHRRPDLRSIPLLLCTAVRGPEEGEGAGVSPPPDGVIRMPFAADELTRAIDDLLHGAHSPGRPTGVLGPAPFVSG